MDGGAKGSSDRGPWTASVQSATGGEGKWAANSAKDAGKTRGKAGLQSHAPCRNQEPRVLSRSRDRVLAGSAWFSVCDNAGEKIELLKSLNFEERKLALAGAAAIGGA